MVYREATNSDCGAIARLHADSWRLNYRGMWHDDYLDGPVRSDRSLVWKKRFAKEDPQRYILLAEAGERLAGFACSFLDHDPRYGTLLDNLHVSAEFKRKGIGSTLMHRSAQWIYQQKPDASFYLWVLEDNQPAIQFYKKLGGEVHETVDMPTPYGEYSRTVRLVWPDLNKLL